jgi:hypothetical protein
MLQEAEASLSGFEKPIVGIHVRRTDKVGTEAAFHDVEEYMKYVNFFSLLIKRSSKSNCLLPNFYRLKNILKGLKSKVVRSFPLNEYMWHQMMPKSWVNVKRNTRIILFLVIPMWLDLQRFPHVIPATHCVEYCLT